MYYFEALSFSDRVAYDDRNGQLADFVNDHLFVLLDALELVRASSQFAPQAFQTIAQRLAWRMVEHLDGFAVLTRAGCSQALQSSARSAFEALLALQYLLETDRDRRALAYQVFELRSRIQFWDNCLPTPDAVFASRKPKPRTWQQQPRAEKIATWKALLLAPPYHAIELAFQEQGPHLPWYALNGGPCNLRELARSLNQSYCYHLLFEMESALGEHDHDFPSLGPGQAQLRPLRSPRSLPEWTLLAGQLTAQAIDGLLNCCGPGPLRAAFAARKDLLIGNRTRALAEQF